jgi:hypothetical protein
VIKRWKEIEGLGAEVLVVAYDEPTLLSAKMAARCSSAIPALTRSNQGGLRPMGYGTHGADWRDAVPVAQLALPQASR